MTLEILHNIPESARKLVFHHIQERYKAARVEVDFELSNVSIVWFTKTLDNWKAFVCTDVADGLYYEVTHNGSKRETYIDAYQRGYNVCIKDDETPIQVSVRKNEVANILAQKPHSRACGVNPHRHGDDCSPDCPTCVRVGMQRG